MRRCLLTVDLLSAVFQKCLLSGKVRLRSLIGILVALPDRWVTSEDVGEELCLIIEICSLCCSSSYIECSSFKKVCQIRIIKLSHWIRILCLLFHCEMKCDTENPKTVDSVKNNSQTLKLICWN